MIGYSTNPPTLPTLLFPMTNNNNENQVFEALLEYLRQSRGFDFTGYKRASLQRRVRKQMQSRNIDNVSEYLDYLQVHPEEFLPLFNTILINVTAFFRDQNAWNYLQDQTLPHLLSEKDEQSQIRVWSAGCASGEEAYTLAMIFAELLGSQEFHQRVKIYATDIDEQALTQARHASYHARQVEAIPKEWLERYFDVIGDRYIFRSDLRRAVIFGRHDLIQDAPISRLDLLVCRNTLMYFNAETQTHILDRFHFALNNTGILFLGKAEMLLTHANFFTPLSLQHRIFRRVPQKNRRNTPILALPILNEEIQDPLNRLQEQLNQSKQELETTNEELQSANEELQTINDELRVRTSDLNQANAFLHSIFASLQMGVIVVDRQFNILTWNHQAENLWGLRSDEVIGRSFLGLDIGLPVGELRDMIRLCLTQETEKAETILNARNRRGKDIQCRINITPLGGGIEFQNRGVILLIEEVG